MTVSEAHDECCRGCGYCLTHGQTPFTCCEKVAKRFLLENGEEWCEKNIKLFEDFNLEKPKIEYKDYIQGKLF